VCRPSRLLHAVLRILTTEWRPGACRATEDSVYAHFACETLIPLPEFWLIPGISFGAVIDGLTTRRLHDASLRVPTALLAALFDICRRVLSSRSADVRGAPRSAGHVSSRITDAATF